MGNCCGKEEGEATDAFARPGRVLGSSDAQAQPQAGRTAPVPRSAAAPAPGPPPTSGAVAPPGSDQDAARRKAAEAAEARAQAGRKSTGKLQSQLDAQKKQTRNDTLREASDQERRVRDADDNTQARTWN